MDARALYPAGHHPVRPNATPDGQKSVSPLPRAGRNVRYYYIDFGLSSRFSKGFSSLVIGDVGRAYVPELSHEIPYDAFKVDIFALGDLYCEEFKKVRSINPKSLCFADPRAEVYKHGVFGSAHRAYDPAAAGTSPYNRSGPPAVEEDARDSRRYPSTLATCTSE